MVKYCCNDMKQAVEEGDVSPGSCFFLHLRPETWWEDNGILNEQARGFSINYCPWCGKKVGEKE
jgi:hypothetical protein